MARNTIIVSVLADTKQLAKGFDESTNDLGRVSSLGKNILKTTAGITLAVGGLALGGGFARALRMDEARTQLGALGYDTKQVQGIMDSALTSVKGTAFGLDAAATIAANALASGIQPGQQLTASLTTVANTAALAKTDMGDMGAVFQKVWANGKVTTHEMNQLADRGVPIWQYLSESFGVSNAELRKMIEGGKVTADMFMNSLGPAVEGMATGMSGSFKGMAANALAALSRVGAMFAGPLLDSAKGFLGETTTLTDGLGERLQPVAERWAAFLGIFSSAGLGAAVLGFLDKILAGVPGVVAFVSTFSPLSILLRSLGPVLPQLAGSATQLAQAFANGLVAIGPSLVDVLGLVLTLAAQIIPPVASLASWVLQVAAGVVTWVVANRDWLSGLGVAAGVIAGVVAAVTAFKAVQLGLVAATYGAQGAMLVAGGAAKVYAVATNLASTATKLAAAGQWALNLAMSANPIGLIVTAIVALVAGLVWFFTQTELGQAIWGEFTRFLGEAWDNTVGVISAGVAWLVNAVTTGISLLQTGWNAAWGAMSAFFSSIWNAIVNGVTGAVSKLVSVVTTGVRLVQTGWNAAWSAISAFFSSIWNAIVNGVTEAVGAVVSVVGDIQSKVVGVLAGVGEWLLSAGQNLVQGFWNGVSGMAGWLKDQVKGFFNGVVDWAKGVLGIHSPSRVFKQIGGFVGQGLADGLGSTENLVAASAASLGNAVVGGFDASLDGGPVAFTVDGNQRGGGNVYQITVEALAATPEIGRIVVDAIRSYEENGGRG